jgi:tRNA (adenine37-N6)-methyltransferase
MRAALSLLLLCLVLVAGESMSAEYTVRPVGEVMKTDDRTVLKIFPQFRDAMFGLDRFSHVIVLYWFDKNDTPEKRSILKVHPRGDERNPLMGVFATRSPMRPNLVGLAVCKIKSVDADGITVDDIDAFDKTPILDLKPYLPHNDCVPDAKVPEWVKLREP